MSDKPDYLHMIACLPKSLRQAFFNAAPEVFLFDDIVPDNLKKLLKQLMDLSVRAHYTCEDPWYSCPKSGECIDDGLGTDYCNCGADTHNEQVEEIWDKICNYFEDDMTGKPEYLKKIEQATNHMTEKQKRAYLEGDPELFTGSYFTSNHDKGQELPYKATLHLTDHQMNMFPGVYWLMFGGRAQGRTEAMAVAVIMHCMNNPHVRVRMTDHYTLFSKNWHQGWQVLTGRIRSILKEEISEVEKRFHFNKAAYTIQYIPEDRDE